MIWILLVLSRTNTHFFNLYNLLQKDINLKQYSAPSQQLSLNQFSQILQIKVSLIRMKQNQWYLNQEFIRAEIQRINHPEYYGLDFQCPDLDNFIQSIKTPEQAIDNRDVLNQFFDQIISSTNLDKSIYVRLKWIAYLNRLIQRIQQNSIIIPLSLKALQVYIDKLSPIQKQLKYFDKYLFKKLFKPYLQYLSKLCMLYMPLKKQKKSQHKTKRQQTDSNKQNVNHTNLNIVQKPITTRRSRTQQQRDQQGVIKWYREYNFVLQTLDTFSTILAQLSPFFKSQMPYLLNIRRYISKDLKNILKRLQQTSLSLHRLNVTLIEQESLENKISEFSQAESNIFDATESILFTNMQDCTKQDIQNFMETPMKMQFASQKKLQIFYN